MPSCAVALVVGIRRERAGIRTKRYEPAKKRGERANETNMAQIYPYTRLFNGICQSFSLTLEASTVAFT